ncbi:MAG: Ig-like domain-containing protein [Muribaculaceae bacterium]|nr:Ig-like domain-containing protein [Muribaculaceae bacterium]
MVAPGASYNPTNDDEAKYETSVTAQGKQSGTINDYISYEFEEATFRSDKQIRLNAKKYIKFSTSDNISITEVVFNCTSASYANITYNSNALSKNGAVQTWNGTATDGLIFNTSSQSRVTWIKITYQTTGPKEPVDYTSLPSFVDVILGNTASVYLGETHPEITWSSADENIATVENGVITGVAKGSTTITATWNAVENEWTAGSAEIKVNVAGIPTMSLISSTDDLELGKFYAIAYNNNVASTAENSNKFSSVEVAIENNTFKANDDVLLFTLIDKNDQGNYLIRLVNYNGTNEYISTTSGETSIYKVNESSAKYASISFTTQKNVNISFTSTTDRTIKWGTSTKDFRNYASSNGAAIQLYKEVEPEIVEQEYYRPRWKEQTLQVGNQFAQATIALGYEHPEVIFSSSNDEVATVEGNVVTAKGVGTAIITGTWQDSENWFGDARAFRVNVIGNKKDPNLRFQHEIIHGKLGVGVAAQAALYDGDGELTYESSNESAVTVDKKTGMIRPGNIVRKGSDSKVFITVTASETAQYNPASAYYILYIDDTPTPTDIHDATFDFTKNTYNMYEFDSTNCTDENNIEYYEATVPDHNTVMIVNEGGVILNFLDREDDIDGFRLWKDLAGENYEEVINYLCLYDAHFSITAPEGCTIDKIEFLDHTDRLGELSANVGTYKGSNDDDEAIWISGDDDISSVEFTSTGKETHFGKIIVTIDKNTAGMKDPNISFKNRTYAVTADQILEGVLGAETKANVNINYSIDNLAENEYQLEETDDNVLNIYIDTPGVYTLRATSEANEEYVAGMAIARIDVFPAYAIETTVDDEEEVYHNTETGIMILPHTGGIVSMTKLEGPYTYNIVEGDDETSDVEPQYYLDGDDELHLTVTPQYAGTFNHTTQQLHVYTKPTPAEHNQNGTEHSFTWNTEKGYKFFYRLDVVPEDAFETKESAPMRAKAQTGQWIEDTTGNLAIDSSDYEIPEGQMLHIATKTVKSTAHGDIENSQNVGILSDGGMSGIFDVEADRDDVHFYNLEGVEMNGELAPGLYIQVKANKAQKVSVK